MKRSVGLKNCFRSKQDESNYSLTANNFAHAIGFRPRLRVRLWLEKIGAIEPLSGNLATCWNKTEEKAVESYKLITGNSVMFHKFQGSGRMNPKDDWLTAPPHAIVDKIVNGKPSQGVLEVKCPKCPSYNNSMSKGYTWSQIPHHCVPKAQGLMAILDKDWMDFYVWTPEGSSLFRMYRDLEYWNVLKTGLSDFWWNHVQPATDKIYNSRSVVSDNLVSELKSLCPAPKHELCSQLVKESKRVVDNSELLMSEMKGKLVDQHRYHVTVPRESIHCLTKIPAELLEITPTGGNMIRDITPKGRKIIYNCQFSVSSGGNDQPAG